MTSPQKDEDAAKPVTKEAIAETRPRALTISLISVSAALYAVAIAVTSPIPTPWGVGHFRPGVVIPAFFTVIFGPFVGGVGAAIGTFIGDYALSLFGLTTPLLSLVAGVPGNLVGFYVMGWLLSKRRSWAAFIPSSFIALLVGNLTAALGVLVYFWVIVPDWAGWTLDLKLTVTIGLTVFWLVTMIIFVVPLVPILVTYVEPQLRRMGVQGISSPRWNESRDMLKSSTTVALILAVLYLLVIYVPGGGLIFAGVLPPELLLLSSLVVFVFGLIFARITGDLAKRLSK